MRAVLALLLATSAAAFSPAAQTSSKSALGATAVDKELGVQAPIGFFDPLGFIKNGPYGGPEENFSHYRSVEVKHGRIAMAATVGTLVQQNSHFTGLISTSENLSFEDVPNGYAALAVVPLAGWCQMIITIGLHEVLVKQRPGKVPGDFGTGYLGEKMDDQSAKQLRALNVELANGRLAMLGILGMWASEHIHGSPLTEVAGLA
eukprot:CAMPEP_0119013862 /NCGR_PEP_ID=MMETSP1176-20130426/9130_1 /TAXON_ID=265551 /ORGANISM="Synedropsis recta cf, Strain CCMP1620" /LENGTH=203 /DNA_ID=CAMNT_0006966987 /DNA_START=50 /DNA_END=661 /DNA_ORIENTATION=+